MRRKRLAERLLATTRSTRTRDPRLPSPRQRRRLVLRVCRLMSTGRYVVVDACRKVGLGSVTRLQDWIQRDQIEGKGELALAYMRAREMSAEGLEMRAMDIAKKTSNWTWQRDRLEIDTLKWAAAKRRPRVYGEKLDLTSDGDALPSVMKVELIKPSKKTRAAHRRSELEDEDDDA